MNDESERGYLGLAALMRLNFEGQSLQSIAEELIRRAKADPGNAASMLDLAIALELNLQPELARAAQAEALKTQALYHLPAAGDTSLRLLALMAPGDISTNAPLDLLLEDSDVSLDLLYVGAGVAPAKELPDHDVMFVAMGESEATRPLLQQLEPVVAAWPRPVINPPRKILQTSRDEAYARLHPLPKVAMPAVKRIERAALEQVLCGKAAIEGLSIPAFPFIIRPLDSHAGHDLERIGSSADLRAYLDKVKKGCFFVSPFVDYKSPDGLYRKYRLALIDGTPFAVHMAISSHWMIHYLNAGMRESKEKRAEEARFMENFHADFAIRHHLALSGIHEALALDYLVIDCAETPSGELLVFEVDTGGVVHALDPPDIFPYKRPAMERIFAAFRELLSQRARSAKG